ncbi:MAG: 6-bladed beta-propeller [Prevotellaceae bacterium]|jgi:hypothetical protein|nr:6-bladed beta-propeller [Prevotellaceae bacterium]
MKLNITLVIAFLIILVSCKHEQEEIKTKTIDSKSVIDSIFNLSKLGCFSNFIPLETNENSIISGINKIYFVDNHIYILDRDGGKGVFIFDRNGKFIRKIGRIGGGPGEYVSIDDFTIDKNNLTVYLLANRENVLLYNIDGKYIRSFKTDFYASKIEYNSSSNKIYFIGDDAGDNLIIADLNGKKIKGFFPNEDFGQHVRILINPFNNLDTTVLYRRFLDDNIYALKDDFLHIHYKIDFGEEALSESKLKELLKLDTKQFKQSLQKFKSHIKYYVENDKNILFYFFHNKIPHLCVYEKGNNKSKTCSIINLQDDILYFETFPLIENITDKNEYVFFVEAENFISNIANIKNDSMKNLANVMIKESNLQYDSNPVICILKPANNE